MNNIYQDKLQCITKPHDVISVSYTHLIRMEFIHGVREKETLEISDIMAGDFEGQIIRMNGAIHKIADMGSFSFVTIRNREGLVQCVWDSEEDKDTAGLKEGMAVEVCGMVAAEARAPRGFEIRLSGVKILAEPAKPLPLAIHKWKINTSLETKLNLRPISLRNVCERAKFKIQVGIVRGFRDFLYAQGFTEIHTPKIVAGNAEGGANVFKMEYFGKKAFLAQSPQFYKQMMVGVYDLSLIHI